MSSSKPTLKTYFKSSSAHLQTAGIEMVNIQTQVGDFKVWTKRIGNNPRIKVLLLHGGPATTHEYMESFESFFPREGFELIEYDQLGSYYSDQPDENSLWTIDRFAQEIEQVREALKLDSSNFYLLGHSWGGLLAIEYALQYPRNLKGLIISNMMASMPAYNKYTQFLIDQIPKTLHQALMRYEERGEFTNPEYLEIIFTEYYKKHLCRLADWPDPILRAFKHLNEKVSTALYGHSKLMFGGELGNWDRSSDLDQITVPTLCIGAKYDTMDAEYIKWMSAKIPNAKYLYCPNGSHLTMWDDQEVYMKGIIKFIKNVDKQ